VVVKPQDGNQGKGVTVNITDRATRSRLQDAAEFGDVMVERFLPGHDFRLLVVGGQLVAAARREPPQVLGDGQHTCASWWTSSTRTRAAAPGHGTALTKIRLDDIAIARLASEA
jgi:cyanophycin synthetase